MNDEHDSIIGMLAVMIMLGIVMNISFYNIGKEEGKEEIFDQAIAKSFGEYKIGENKKVIFVWHTNLAKTK